MTTQEFKRWFQWKTVPRNTSRRRKGEASGGFPTPEDVLKLAAFKYLQPTDPSKPQDSTRAFTYHLEKIRKVVIVDITQKLESLWVTVECSSLRILQRLWDDCCIERLSGLAQNTFVSEYILKELGLTNVKLRTTISEKEYKDCRGQFLQSLGEYESLFHIYAVFSYLSWGEQGNKHERTIFLCSWRPLLFYCPFIFLLSRFIWKENEREGRIYQPNLHVGSAIIFCFYQS